MPDLDFNAQLLLYGTLGVLTLAAWFLPPVIRRMRAMAGA